MKKTVSVTNLMVNNLHADLKKNKKQNMIQVARITCIW